MSRLLVVTLTVLLLAGGALAEPDRGPFALGLAYGGTSGFWGVSLRVQASPTLELQPIFFLVADGGDLMGNAALRLNYSLGSSGNVYRYALMGGAVDFWWREEMTLSGQAGLGIEWPWSLPWGLSQPLRQSLEFVLGGNSRGWVSMGLGHSIHYYF